MPPLTHPHFNIQRTHCRPTVSWLCFTNAVLSLRTSPYSLSELFPLIHLSRINSDIISAELVSKHPIEHEAIETVHLIICISCQTLCHPLPTLTFPKPGTVIATSLAFNTATLDLMSYPRHHSKKWSHSSRCGGHSSYLHTISSNLQHSLVPLKTSHLLVFSPSGSEASPGWGVHVLCSLVHA